MSCFAAVYSCSQTISKEKLVNVAIVVTNFVSYLWFTLLNLELDANTHSCKCASSALSLSILQAYCIHNMSSFRPSFQGNPRSEFLFPKRTLHLT